MAHCPPQIVADDVKCTHGCTVSDLEEEELFYLRCGHSECFVPKGEKAALRPT